ncbi:hypothetical protein EYB26_008747 [Talaromyces marneffei]|uniref:uncharacterized protein n=1 Tax=Talaromyces marneffei TaxID=37727 RepID=UPI0012A87821|nr:uncharacterized protein EYB26_008747 [Talaromyces marneffei]QGA21037.1 hypothetical protein EYB26_008747 [Talaromyces marneffei]
MFRLPFSRIPEMSGDQKPPPTSTETIKLRGEIIFIPTNETYAESDSHLLEPTLRTLSIHLYLWDDRLVLSGRQFLQWRCSHKFRVVIRRDGDSGPLFESLIEFDRSPDTSWRTLRAEIEIPTRMHWEDKVRCKVGSDGNMPVYDVRGVVLGHKEMRIQFMAFGNTEDNGPRLMHIYKDDDWNREREILAGLGFDKSVMAGLEEL